MPNYSWKGRTRGGRVQEGVLVAESKEAAVASLRKQQIIVTAVTEIERVGRVSKRLFIAGVLTAGSCVAIGGLS